MMKVDLAQSVGVVSTAAGTAVAANLNETLYTISLILTILGTIWTFIICPLIKWYRKSKQDGKIDKDEIKEGLDILNDGIEKTKETIESEKDK